MENAEISNAAASPNPLRAAAIVIYASLALLWLAIPQSVSNWSRDYLPGFVQPVSTPIVSTVETIAIATRIPLLYEYARGIWQFAVKKR
jgi:hypothetical protein